MKFESFFFKLCLRSGPIPGLDNSSDYTGELTKGKYYKVISVCTGQVVVIGDKGKKVIAFKERFHD